MIGHNSQIQDIVIMFIIMVIASFLSGMNMWVDNFSDVRIHLNDFYMGSLMAGWMFLLFGLFYSLSNYTYIGLGLIIIFIYLIRNQIFIDQNQYINSMIPHHSMAIFMSKQIRDKNIVSNKELENLINKIIDTQQNEINLMKSI